MSPADLVIITSGLLAILGLATTLYRRRRSIERQLQRRVAEAGQTQILTFAPDPVARTDGWDRRFTSALNRSSVEMSVGQWTTIVALAAVVGALTLGFVASDTAAAAIGLVLGALVPFGALRVLLGRRRRRLQDQLPDAIFLIARAMRAGSGLERSFELCADQVAEPLRGEIQRALGQVGLGLSISTALTGMGDRLELEDLDLLVATVRLHQTTGGNLAHLVDLVATGARARNQFRLQLQSATSLSRVSAAFVAAAMPVLLIVYLSVQPEFLLAFLHAPVGQAALAFSIFLEVVGVLWLIMILRIRY